MTTDDVEKLNSRISPRPCTSGSVVRALPFLQKSNPESRHRLKSLGWFPETSILYSPCYMQFEREHLTLGDVIRIRSEVEKLRVVISR